MQARDTKITIDLSGLEKLRKELGKKYVARVGVLGQTGGATHQTVKTTYNTKTGEPQYKKVSPEGGITNAELAVIHELGSETRGIPPRSFLRMPIETKMQDIVKYLGTSYVRKIIDAGNIRRVFQLIGAYGEAIIQEAFQTRGYGQWAPNDPQTIKRKGSSSPLIQFGELRRSVSSDVVKNAP